VLLCLFPWDGDTLQIRASSIAQAAAISDNSKLQSAAVMMASIFTKHSDWRNEPLVAQNCVVYIPCGFLSMVNGPVLFAL
jgi:hypothetical protein